MSKSQITTFLNIDSNHYEKIINTIRKLKKPDIIYKVNFKHYEFIVFGELNFETGVILGNKFSGDFSNIKGFDKIIENIAMNTMTPLEELLSRYNIVNEDRDDTNISQFQNSK